MRLTRAPVSVVGIALCLAVAAAALGLSISLFSKLWGYQDSPSWIYVLWGLFWLGIALLMGVFAWAIARRRRL